MHEFLYGDYVIENFTKDGSDPVFAQFNSDNLFTFVPATMYDHLVEDWT